MYNDVIDKNDVVISCSATKRVGENGGEMSSAEKVSCMPRKMGILNYSQRGKVAEFDQPPFSSSKNFLQIMSGWEL